MRKKPFLSLYEETRVKSTKELSVATESSGETSDEDEYSMDTTIITRTIETDDEDSYIIGSSVTTDSIEDSDVDNYMID